MKMRRILLLLLLTFVAVSVSAQTAVPVLFYTDIDSGPATGGEGGTDGAFLCVYGENFGASPATVTIGGTAVAQYKLWTDPGQPYQAGTNVAKACVQISHLTPAGLQNVQLTTAQGSSNTLPFTVRSGSIWWVSTSGDDVNGNGSQASPWASIAQCKNQMAPGDICVIQDGVTVNSMESWEAAVWLNSSGTPGNPKAIVAYPGADVSIADSVATGTWGTTSELQGINNYNDSGTQPCGSAGCSYWTIAGFQEINGSSAGVSLSGGSNIRLVDNDILCQGVYCDGAAAGLVASTPHLSIYGNRFHDIGCHEDVDYSNSAYPCVWISAGVTISTSGSSFTLAGAANGLSEGDVILANGQLRRIVSCNGNCLAGLASGILDAAFIPDLPLETAFQYRDFVPNKTWENIYFNNGSNSVQFAWNNVDGSVGKACRGLFFYANMLDSTTGYSLYDLHVHDNWIHDTVCDGINFASIDPSQGTVEAYNNVIYNAGEGNGSTYNDGNSVGVLSDYVCIYSPGYVNNGVPGSGSLLVYNNTLYNCGSRVLLGNAASEVGGISAIAGAATNLYVVASNNIIVSVNPAVPYLQTASTTNHFCTAATAYCPSASVNNVLYGSEAAAPSYLAGNILTNPDFRAAPSDFHLTGGNPAAAASSAGLASIMDFDGQVRSSSNPTPGAYEYLANFISSIRPLGPTTTTITASANPQNYGSPVWFTIVVSPVNSSSVVPSGPVLVYDGSVLLTQVTPDVSGNAAFAVGSLMPGTHAIKAVYSGDANFAGSQGSMTELINGPILTLSATALSFSSPLNITSVPQTITLTNTGTSPLMMNSAVFSGVAALAQVSGTCFPTGTATSLAVNASCYIQVAFRPAAATTPQRATLRINVAVPGVSQSVALSGSVVAPTFTLSPAALSFGNQMLDRASAYQAVTVTNTSPLANLTITGISGWQPSFYDCGHGQLPATLGPGAYCTIQVSFLPRTVGLNLGQLKVSVAAPGTSKSISLSGTGFVPTFTLSPAALSFGNQPVGVASAQQTVTVTNTSSLAALSITGISLNANWVLSAQTCPLLPATLAPGATCTMNVAFRPLTAGSMLTPFKVSVAAPGTSQSIALSGTGAAPISTAPSQLLSFGGVIRGTTKTMVLAVVNPARNPELDNLSVSFSGSGDFSRSTVSPGTCGTTLAGGAMVQSCTFYVVYAPAGSEGKGALDSGALTITGSQGPVAQTTTVILRGTPN
jgi:hypothetical protein